MRKVSILVIMDLALELAIFHMLRYERSVSILVIMDLALESCAVLHLVNKDRCFNPCYNGSCFGIGFYFHASNQAIPVSILVIMDLALESRPRAVVSSSIVFQSLL
ncbi:MAG: hypothetical protein PWP14_1246 [Methanolobus sp.]|nr:hypothetical protein [Methanolobus sp.]